MASQALVAKVRTVRELLKKSEGQIKMALPKHLTVEKMMRVVMTSIQQNPALLDCDQTSLIQAVIESAQLGLIPDSILGHAHLIPFAGKVKLIPGYKGYLELAERSDRVRKISAHAVFANDKFEYRYGLHEDLIHEPHRGDGRGELIAAYAVCWKISGDPIFEVVEASDVLPIKQKALSQKRKPQESPWTTAEPEMWRKTAIRRLAKFIPQSPDLQRMAAREEALDMGVDIDAPIDLEEGKDFSTQAMDTDVFRKALPPDVDVTKILEFVEFVAKDQEETTDAVQANALKRMDMFISAFRRWEEKQKTKEKDDKPPWYRLGVTRFTEILMATTKEKFMSWPEDWQNDLVDKAKRYGLNIPWVMYGNKPASEMESAKGPPPPPEPNASPGAAERPKDEDSKFMPPIQGMEQSLRTAFARVSKEIFIDRRKRWWIEIKKNPEGWHRELTNFDQNHAQAEGILNDWWNKGIQPDEKQRLLNMEDDNIPL